MILKIVGAEDYPEDIYRDLVRIPRKHRLDGDGEEIWTCPLF